MDHYKKYIAGGLSGIVEVTCTYPLDYLKVKQQEHAQKHTKLNFLSSLKNNNSFLSMYKGVGSRILGVVPIRFTFWGVQNSSHLLLAKNKMFDKFSTGIISGATGGFCQTIIDNPVENYKIQKIIGEKPNIKNILKNNYGFTPNLCRNIGFATAVSTICIQNNTDDNLTNFALASSSAVVGTIATQPFDYVKTQSQRTQKKSNLFQSLFNIIKKEPKVLYTGCLNRCFLNFFSMGIGYVACDNIYKSLFT